MGIYGKRLVVTTFLLIKGGEMRIDPFSKRKNELADMYHPSERYNKLNSLSPMTRTTKFWFNPKPLWISSTLAHITHYLIIPCALVHTVWNSESFVASHRCSSYAPIPWVRARMSMPTFVAHRAVCKITPLVELQYPHTTPYYTCLLGAAAYVNGSFVAVIGPRYKIKDDEISLGDWVGDTIYISKIGLRF